MVKASASYSKSAGVSNVEVIAVIAFICMCVSAFKIAECVCALLIGNEEKDE